MGVDMAILEPYDIAYHEVDTSNLVVVKSDVNGAHAVLVLIEDWELIAKVLDVCLII